MKDIPCGTLESKIPFGCKINKIEGTSRMRVR
jgi:hypothetical protein